MYLKKAITSVTDMPLRLAKANHFCKICIFVVTSIDCFFFSCYPRHLSVVSETRLVSLAAVFIY